MKGLERRDRRAVRDLARVIEHEWDAPAFENVASSLRSMLHADIGGVYRLGVTDGKTHLEFLHQVGGPREFEEVFGRYADGRQWTQGSAAYDPVNPAQDERNVVKEPTATLTEAWRATSIGIRDFLTPLGLQDLRQLRILVCDGPVFLGWVGVFSSRPFRAKDRAMLGALTQPLVRRLRIDKRLRDAEIDARARDVALEALGGPAFVVRGEHVLHANEAGRALLDARAIDVAARIRAARAGVDPHVQLLPIPSPGAAGARSLTLVIIDVVHSRSDLGRRIARATQRWRLTPRQATVLSLVVHGEANKAIAERLRCAVVTVEIHVSAILRKADVESRSSLIATFWTALA